MRLAAKLLGVFAVVLGSFVIGSDGASANHAWGPYHWGRSANPFTLKLGDNVSGTWDAHLAIASSQWSLSAVLDTPVVPGGTPPRPCRPTIGRVEVCNATYGNNGWLGLAQIWVYGDGHIAQGVAKMNDTYFNTPTYNTTAWRQVVMCQEIGHILGLAHQDENSSNSDLLDQNGKASCMDYSADPSNNQQPNQHDYDQLVTIYTHLDNTTTVGQAAASGPGRGNLPPAASGDLDNPSEWGRLIRQSPDGRLLLFERDLGRGHKMFTFVTRA